MSWMVRLARKDGAKRKVTSFHAGDLDRDKNLMSGRGEPEGAQRGALPPSPSGPPPAYLDQKEGRRPVNVPRAPKPQVRRAPRPSYRSGCLAASHGYSPPAGQSFQRFGRCR